MNTRLFVAFLVVIFASSASVAQSNGKDETALRSLIDKMTSAQSSYDAAALDRILTADYIEVSPAGEFDPRDKVLTFYTPAAKAGAAGMVINIEEEFRSVRFYGDVAVVIAELSFLITRDGTTSPPRKMMLTAVCKKANGEWKIASTQFTGIRPTGPMAPAAKPAIKPQ